MKTVLTSSPDEAAAFIRRGQLAAFPTETVYGLGVDALNGPAARGVYEVKGRPFDNPMIVHLADASEVGSIVRSIPAHAVELVKSFFPGPLTIVLEKAEQIPKEVTGGLETVGVRVPSHPVAHQFLAACGRPVAAPSANTSGKPSPTSWRDVAEDLDGLIACILRGDRSRVGLESTVVDCTGKIPVVLRVGAVSLQALRSVVPATQPPSAAGPLERRSPGLRYRHYAPRARVRVYDSTAAFDTHSKAYIGTSPISEHTAFDKVVLCESLDQYAHELYQFFRACDRDGIEVIYCETPAPSGIGSALLDRILRASEQRDETGDAG